MTGHPLGHVRDTVLDLPEYDLKILLNGYPAHSVRCRRGWAHRDRIRQPDYDPSDRVRNECLDVVCDCGTDGRYAQYLEDQLTALRAQAEAGLREIAGRITYWDQCNIKWQEGLTDDYRGGWVPIDPEHIGETYAEWAGPRPEPADHLTMWMPDEQAGGES